MTNRLRLNSTPANTVGAWAGRAPAAAPYGDEARHVHHGVPREHGARTPAPTQRAPGLPPTTRAAAGRRRRRRGGGGGAGMAGRALGPGVGGAPRARRRSDTSDVPSPSAWWMRSTTAHVRRLGGREVHGERRQRRHVVLQRLVRVRRDGGAVQGRDDDGSPSCGPIVALPIGQLELSRCTVPPYPSTQGTTQVPLDHTETLTKHVTCKFNS